MFMYIHNRLYSVYTVDVSTTSKNAKSVFISVRKGRLGTESSFSLLEVETAESPFLNGDSHE